MSKKITIMGFGNPVREDDGVGIYVVQELMKHISDPDIEVLDMGTAAFEVLFKLKGRDKIVLVDAVVNTGEPVGTLYKLPADQIDAKINDDPLVFLHSLKWDQALSYAKKMLGDEYPQDIEVYLIAINETRFNTEMTPPAIEASDKLVDIILTDLGIKTEA